ncbi:MAG: DUF4393 domain-containing protein [Sulfuriferula sp.]
MTNGWLQVAQEALKVPGLLIEIYGDLARPGVRQVGKALETVMGLGNTVLWPIALANERSRIALERNLESYRKNLESIPEEKIAEVAPEIGVPIAEKLAYVLDERLSEMYVKLLATASNIDTLGDAHPSFVNVINNLSPDEAHFLEYFVTHPNAPFVRATALVPSNGNHSIIGGPLVPTEMTSTLAFPNNADAYLSNLAGLGLLNIRDDIWLAEPTRLYEPLENQQHAQFTALIENSPQLKGRRLDFKKGVIEITSFGLKFINACHTK